jgi:hypothetical protein
MYFDNDNVSVIRTKYRENKLKNYHWIPRNKFFAISFIFDSVHIQQEWMNTTKLLPHNLN